MVTSYSRDLQFKSSPLDKIEKTGHGHKELFDNFFKKIFQDPTDEDVIRDVVAVEASGGREGSRHGLSRLSIRKGRSVVHKNLEDNYGAVISANHEALAQILEQVKTI